MKIIKLALILLIMSVSSSFAQSAMDENLTPTPAVAELAVEAPTVLESTPKDEFISILTKFVSSGVLAYLLYLFFPKFSKKTSKLLVEKNKFRIVFEAMKVMAVLMLVTIIGAFIMIGFYPAMVAISLVLALYFLGSAVFSMGVLEWLFAIKGIKFEKLTKQNQFISLISINLIIMVFVLPFALLVPDYEVIVQNQIIKVDILSNLLIFIISIMGVGMLAIRFKEVLIKHKAKL